MMPSTYDVSSAAFFENMVCEFFLLSKFSFLMFDIVYLLDSHRFIPCVNETVISYYFISWIVKFSEVVFFYDFDTLPPCYISKKQFTFLKTIF